MDELIKSLQLGESVTPVVTVWAVLFASVLSALLSMLVGVLYRRIHMEAAYSQALVLTFVMLAMVTALIMTLIGSNIARAFSLVGALSIIRFRAAIKSPLDVGFLFFAIAIGMGCGTGFHAVTAVATFVISGTMLALRRFNFGSYPSRAEFLLSARFPMETDHETALEPLLGKFFESYSLAYMETVDGLDEREIVYSVRPRADVTNQQVVDAVREQNGNRKVVYRTIRHAIEVP
jgi:hypothetical protein